MPIKYKIPLADGKRIADLSEQELRTERDAFTKWVDLQKVPIKNADYPFMEAFRTLILCRQGHALFLPAQEEAATGLLEQGFYFSETQKNVRKHEHAAHNKGKGWKR